jgi:signal peptidase I
MEARLTNRRSRIARALGCFALVGALYAYGFRLARVQGRSMEPTFHKNQWLLVRRLNWPAPRLRRGDVIVFTKDGDMLVKRIAALAGEPVPTEQEHYELAPEVDTAPRAVEEGRERVPEGDLYVMGDNRYNSEDSRDYGPIPRTTVLGRVLHIKAGRRAPRRGGDPPAGSDPGHSASGNEGAAP